MYYNKPSPRNIYCRLCYKAALCNAGNRISGQAARDQARQAKVESDKSKKALRRWRKKRNALSETNPADGEKNISRLELLTSRSDSSDESIKPLDSPVQLPPIGQESSVESSFLKSPGDNITAETSYNDVFSSFCGDGADEASATFDPEILVLGSEAMEMNDTEAGYVDGVSKGTGMLRSPGRSISMASDICRSPGGKKNTGQFGSTTANMTGQNREAENPFSSNVFNDYGGAGGLERSSEWNLFSSRMAETLPEMSPARHRTGPSTLAFENHVAKVVNGPSKKRFAKGNDEIEANQSVSKILNNGMSRVLSPLAPKSYFFSCNDDELNIMPDQDDSVSEKSQTSDALKWNALTSKSLLSDPSYFGRSMLNLTKLK